MTATALSTACSGSSSWAAFCNDFDWANAMMILWLLKKDFKPPSRQVKAAGNIRVCLWSFQGVRSVCPQKSDHILESRKVVFNWLINNGEGDWAGGWLNSATAEPGENSLQYSQAHGTLWLTGAITLHCRTPEPRLQHGTVEPHCPKQACPRLGNKMSLTFLTVAEPSPSLYTHYSVLVHCTQRPRADC